MSNPTETSSSGKVFPSFNVEGESVNARDHIEPKTGLAVFLGYCVLLILLIVALATIYLFVALLIGLVAEYIRQRRALAMLRGSAIEVGPAQFPEIHQCAATIARRLTLASPPAIYVVEGNTINAAALKVAGRHVIVLHDDIVDACLRSGDPHSLAFVIAHEMAHHALGHTNQIRAHIRGMLKWLSRLDEFSCDAVANKLVGSPLVSAKALIILLTGPQLLPYLNVEQLIVQARQVVNDKRSKKAEKHLTHPLLLRRLHRFVAV